MQFCIYKKCTGGFGVTFGQWLTNIIFTKNVHNFCCENFAQNKYNYMTKIFRKYNELDFAVWRMQICKRICVKFAQKLRKITQVIFRKISVFLQEYLRKNFAKFSEHILRKIGACWVTLMHQRPVGDPMHHSKRAAARLEWCIGTPPARVSPLLSSCCCASSYKGVSSLVLHPTIPTIRLS